MENSIYLTLDGIEKEYHILFEYYDEENEREYVFIYLPEDETNIFPFYKVEDQLIAVEDQEEFEFLSDLLENYLAEQESEEE